MGFNKIGTPSTIEPFPGHFGLKVNPGGEMFDFS